ncbi:coniferyl aldehyde dehydrogenase [Bradyrhizobium sp. Arg68]|uniref:coniferyl aldehyde dehydrogenase n=1 Tax=Bradyrhizobium ivorense TaxID=2511166 RepID=UPI001E5D74B2|nr:coniferyl aldehyde dehydrogenase [Bradyrhizobium ivorense]MCC8937079.1 coniferyl aldehyde dehydrogenase [Bradyrhizobium ivorense]
MTMQASGQIDKTLDRLGAILANQKAAFLAEGVVSPETRRDRLSRLIHLTCENGDAIVDAIVQDFDGAKSRHFTLMSELLGKVHGMEHARDHLASWMKPETREPTGAAKEAGAVADVIRQPKGVVGIMSPWNMPFGLSVSPLTSALAAGNRAMIKPSEFTPTMSALMEELFSRYFSPEEIAVVVGGVEVGEAFARLPFDHLLFTGSTSVGRHVMRLASENLVPVTLELGGKSPVIIGSKANIAAVAPRLAFAKMANGGQLCLAPDYVLVAKQLEAALVDQLINETSAMFPRVHTNSDHTGIINSRHFDRLENLVNDARSKGARITVVGASSPGRQGSNARRMPLHIVQNVSEKMALMDEEIFGPVLPIIPFERIEEAVSFVRRRPKPLALYYFGRDAAEEQFVLEHTESGGVTTNGFYQHYLQENLPFGGVGASGMGAYHGRDGFIEFSHTRAVLLQAPDAKQNPALRPPLTDDLLQFFRSELKRRIA